jgi:NADPH:quinone reductase-like Zn-dependent oxidoreductase
MKALILKGYGGADRIELADVPKPAIEPDEILVRIHAAGLNPVDNAIVKGQFKPLIKLRLPSVLGSDLAGVVVETGSRVSRFKVGDAVFASTFDQGFGTLAEFAAVPERLAAHKPLNLDFVQAASLPMVALTSWQALAERAQIQRGQNVFTWAPRWRPRPVRATWSSCADLAPTR